MVNYALFTAEELDQMAKHGATAEIRDRAKDEQVIRKQDQVILDLHAKIITANQRIAELEAFFVSEQQREEFYKEEQQREERRRLEAEAYEKGD